MKLIIFVHTCKKYEESRAKLIEQTWGNEHTCGHKNNIVFITDSPQSTLKNHIYIGEYKKGPTYHPETVYKMFVLFLEKYSHYDWFMIIDDDSYLYIKKLENYLSFFDPKECYWIAEFLNWVAPRSEPNFTCDYNRWPSGGPGMVFSKKSIETFLHLMRTISIPQNINHDVWLHLLFQHSDKRMKRVDCPGFHQYNAKILLQKYSKYDNQLISVHLEHNMDLMKEYHIAE